MTSEKRQFPKHRPLFGTETDNHDKTTPKHLFFGMQGQTAAPWIKSETFAKQSYRDPTISKNPTNLEDKAGHKSHSSDRVLGVIVKAR